MKKVWSDGNLDMVYNNDGYNDGDGDNDGDDDYGNDDGNDDDALWWWL